MKTGIQAYERELKERKSKLGVGKGKRKRKGEGWWVLEWCYVGEWWVNDNLTNS
jgi:hypothetical protein